MRKIVFVSLVLLVLFSFTGCKEETYAFKKTVNEIERVEIVSAKNSLAFTVIKTLSETEKTTLLKDFKRSNLMTILLEIQCLLAEMP